MKQQLRPGRAVRTAFVVEQTLGHVTHYRNMRSYAALRTDVAPEWLPIAFDVSGPARFVPLVRSNWSVRASWRARRALDAIQAREPLDAIVFHTQVTSLLSRAHMRQTPTIVSLDATPINYDSVGAAYGHQAAGTGFVDRQKFRLNQLALHEAAQLVTWSDWTKRSVIDDYGVDGDKVRVLAPGAAPEYFNIGETRSFTFNGKERVRLLFVGGDFQRKGGPLLLQLMRDPYLAERCELHLVTGANVPEQPNVFVHRGLQANSPELLRQFAQADLFILPTYADCLAVVLMEATAAGLPVITTDVGALSEAVTPGKSGLLIEPGNAAALRAAVAALVDDPARRQSMSSVGHALARDKFDAQRNNGALLDLVVELGLTQQHMRRAA
jgi:glycosyl transferase family 1/glycosyl transferase family 4